MSLPRRQQRILDQIEQALHAADPRLKSMFALLGPALRAKPGPAVEALSDRPSRRTVVILMMVVVSLLGVLVVGIRSTSGDCPGQTSDQAAAAALARYDGCSQSTAVWSRGGH
jgi:Protein of unknown function (DUF3040)